MKTRNTSSFLLNNLYLKRIIPIIIISILYCSCNNSIEKQIESKIQRITELSELGSVEYTVKKVIKANDVGEWYKIGDRKILFNCTAYLKAGIDLDGLTMENFKIDSSKKEAVITLPRAKLLSINMPTEETELVYDQISLLRSGFTAEERTMLLRQGEKDIVADIENIGILKEAENNITDFFKAMLSQMGFRSIIINFQ